MSPKKIEVAFSLAIAFFLVWTVWEARDWPLHSKLFPWSLGFSVLVLALIQVVVALSAAWNEGNTRVKEKKSGSGANGAAPGQRDRIEAQMEIERADPGFSASDGPALTPEAIRRRVVAICGWILIFFLGIWLLGFKVGSLFLTFAFLKFTASEKWSVSAAVAVGIYLFFLVVFDLALKVPLGNGFVADYFDLDSLDSYLIIRPILGFFAA